MITIEFLRRYGSCWVRSETGEEKVRGLIGEGAPLSHVLRIRSVNPWDRFWVASRLGCEREVCECGRTDAMPHAIRCKWLASILSKGFEVCQPSTVEAFGRVVNLISECGAFYPYPSANLAELLAYKEKARSTALHMDYSADARICFAVSFACEAVLRSSVWADRCVVILNRVLSARQYCGLGNDLMEELLETLAKLLEEEGL